MPAFTSAEAAITGGFDFNYMQPGSAAGDTSVAGFARSASYNVGETVEFCVTGGSTAIRIFRFGWYDDGASVCREIASIANTPTTQPDAVEITDSNGGVTATAWSVTATWTVPETAVSGIYMAMIRNAADNDAFYVTFVVRDDAAEADIIYKTSDTTWGAAYNWYGGKNVYGSGTGVGNIMDRCYAVSYHRPVITRLGVMQTFWWACELPLIRFLERSGFSIKYVTSVDLDKTGVSLLTSGKVFLSSGHDEYWTLPMRRAVEAFRDNYGRHSIFMSGNEVLWKARFEHNESTGESVLWCYKDSMPGPTGVSHVAGAPLDPVEWTGTWKDTRWADREPEWFLTGTDFGMNGVYDYDAVIPQNPYGGLKVWGGSSLVDSDITLTGVIGFEADHARPTQPEGSYKYLATYTRAAPGGLSDANGQNYNVPGNIEWGIVSQRYESGAVTVGFGTCQWSWALDSTHDRGGGTPSSLAAQQFTTTLLHDLGATPVTPATGVTLLAKNGLDSYGTIPGGHWTLKDGTSVTPKGLIDGTITELSTELY